MPDPSVLEMPMADTSSKPNTRDKFVCVALSSSANFFFLKKKSKLSLTIIICFVIILLIFLFFIYLFTMIHLIFQNIYFLKGKFSKNLVLKNYFSFIIIPTLFSDIQNKKNVTGIHFMKCFTSKIFFM